MKKEAAVKKETKIWALLAPVVVLVAICLVITAALAFTDQATAPIIAAAEEAKAKAALLVVLPDGTDFKALENVAGMPEAVTAASEAGNGAGYVFTVESKGYDKGLIVMVGLDDKGAIVGVKVLSNNETAGIGSNVVADGSEFMDQLPGMSDTSGIQAMSGATMSSNGMKNAVQTAFDAYTVVTGGTVEPKLSTKPATLTDKAIEKYFPGAALTEVPGGQVSDMGTIVYGEAQGMQSVIHVAVFFDENKNIVGVVADTLGETEYIGDVIGQNEAFMGQFVGAADVDQIDAVSNATMTSDAVKDSVKQAIANYDIVKGAA